MGTSCSYSPDIHMSEDNYLLGEPEQSLYTYAMIKRLRRLWPLALSAFFGFIIAGIFLTPTAYSRNANMYQILKEKMTDKIFHCHSLNKFSII